MKYLNVLAMFFGTPWAICEAKYWQLRGVILARAGGEVASDEVKAAAASSRRREEYDVVGRVAIIPIMGTISQRIGPMGSGGTSTEDIARQIDAAIADPAVSKILLQIDSPGGSVYGVQELADKIRAARDVKKIVAVADPVAASAAYHLGSQASEFYVAPSGQVGSVGVIIEHVDFAEADKAAGIKTTLVKAGAYKQESHPAFPLSDEAAAHLQETVDIYYSQMVANIAKGRGLSAAAVEKNFGGGRMLTAAAAKTAGMVDGVRTFAQTLGKMNSETNKSAVIAKARVAEIS